MLGKIQCLGVDVALCNFLELNFSYNAGDFEIYIKGIWVIKLELSQLKIMWIINFQLLDASKMAEGAWVSYKSNGTKPRLNDAF